MKMILALVVLFIGFNLFADPEDHASTQACYALQDNNKDASVNVPTQVCLESLSISPEYATISIYSYFFPNLYKNLKLMSFVRQTEDFYSFSASSLLHNDWKSGCDNGESVNLVISGQVDFTGLGNVDELNITVEQQVTNDTCHSTSRQYIFKYVKQ